MTKEGTIACLKASNYTQMEVRNLISQIDIGKKYVKPNYLKKGDLYIETVGVKQRPVVVVKVLEECVVGIPLTTLDHSLCLSASRSRFGRDGWFTKQLVTSTKEFAMDNFGGVYDNPKLLNKACKALKEYANSVL